MLLCRKLTYKWVPVPIKAPCLDVNKEKASSEEGCFDLKALSHPNLLAQLFPV